MEFSGFFGKVYIFEVFLSFFNKEDYDVEEGFDV